MRTYFGGEFSEAAIRSNFVLVYELLDEVADHGWPQVRSKKNALSSGRGRSGKNLKKGREKTHFLLPLSTNRSLSFSSTSTGHGRQFPQGPRLPERVHHRGRPRQEGGRRCRRDAAGHGRGRLEARRPQVQAQRGVPGRDGKGFGAGRGRRDGAAGGRESLFLCVSEEEEEGGAPLSCHRNKKNSLGTKKKNQKKKLDRSTASSP